MSEHQSKQDAEFLKSSFEFARQFGTYEIQKTADTENPFPQIAQGIAKKEKDTSQNEK